jgi:aspartate kinase
MALKAISQKAVSYTGGQVKVLTDSAFTKARILSIDDHNIRRDLAGGNIVVVAGFQGVDEAGSVTTLGRGGSDTSAVAIAAALKADECQIYTDVDGVYTTDPRVVPKARRMERVAFEEMLEMASLGAKVLQVRSVEVAMVHRVPTYVRSSFDDPANPGEGTLICNEEDIVETQTVTGVAFSRDEAQITLRHVSDKPGVAAAVFMPLAEAGINVDMIVQVVSQEGMTDMTFTVG